MQIRKYLIMFWSHTDKELSEENRRSHSKRRNGRQIAFSTSLKFFLLIHCFVSHSTYCRWDAGRRWWTWRRRLEFPGISSAVSVAVYCCIVDTVQTDSAVVKISINVIAPSTQITGAGGGFCNCRGSSGDRDGRRRFKIIFLNCLPCFGVFRFFQFFRSKI